MSRVCINQNLNKLETLGQTAFRHRGPKYAELEQTLFYWMYEMHNSRKRIFIAFIQLKALHLSKKANEHSSFSPKSSQIFVRVG